LSGDGYWLEVQAIAAFGGRILAILHKKYAFFLLSEGDTVKQEPMKFAGKDKIGERNWIERTWP
jgi:hypothetical protein